MIAAGFAYAVVNAHNGCLHLEVTVTGKQAHAAMPDTGVDALEAATSDPDRALCASRRARRARARRRPASSSPTLNVGLIKGGINTNVVPDQVVFRIDRRMIPEEDPAKVEAELRALIAAAAQSHPQASASTCGSICWRRRSRRSPARSGSPPRSSATPRPSWASTCR